MLRIGSCPNHGIRTGIKTPHGDALTFDRFNFDRRPGELFRRL